MAGLGGSFDSGMGGSNGRNAQRAVCGRFTELPSRSNQQISRKILKGVPIFQVDVGAPVLLETEGEEPPVALICRDEGSRSATFLESARGVARTSAQHIAHPDEDVSHRNPDADGKPLPSLKVL